MDNAIVHANLGIRFKSACSILFGFYLCYCQIYTRTSNKKNNEHCSER